MTLDQALAATSREPTTSERRQLAMLAAHVAHEAIKAGNLVEAQAYLADAVAHLRAARGIEPVQCLRVVGSLDGLVK